MKQRDLRNEIFKILFEKELVSIDVEIRSNEIIEEIKASKAKKEYLLNYVEKFSENEEKVVKKIEEIMKGWTFSRLGAVERVILKMAFYEIVIEEVGHEIVINEAIELAKMYGDENSSSFINGILGDLVKTIN